MQSNFNTLLQTIQQYKLFPPNHRFIVAVSGGADSIALLHWLVHHQSQLNIDLHVATLNHGLRPDAAKDVAYVQQFCDELGVSCETGFVDVPSLANQHNLGIEAAARKARYDFLANIAKENDSAYIVTAHHADDQAETILMHIIRGSGTQGLVGMTIESTVPHHPKLTLLRPLLNISRSEIDAYCRAHGLSPRIDETNQDTRFLRNQLRHEILPRLQQINPQISDALRRLSEIVQTEREFIAQNYQENYKHQLAFDERVSVPKDFFKKCHRAMQRYMVQDALEHLSADTSFEHIEHAIEIALKGQVGAIVEFSGDARLRIAYDNLYIEPVSVPLPMEDYLQITGTHIVNIPGETAFEDWILSATIEEPLSYDARLALPPDATVYVRPRQAGDRFMPQGMGGHSKKLKDWFIDKKIPRHVRSGIPLIVVDNTMGAIVLPQNWAIAEPFIVHESSQRIIHFKVKRL